MDDLLGRARAWAAQDPDPLTRDALTRLVADAAAGGSLDALADAFSQRLAFGTAGLRGAVGPGPNRMNLVTVMQAAAGLAAYLIERGGGAVVIGYDARCGDQRADRSRRFGPHRRHRRGLGVGDPR